MQSIGYYAFGTADDSISIPPSVIQICDRAFEYCESLVKIEIPSDSKLQTIGSDAFLGTKIESI